MLKRSKTGDCEMLDIEFVLVDTEFKRRKFWENWVLENPSTDGQAQMAETNRGRLRQILKSARGITPNDTSPQARAAYTASLRDFDNINFIGKIGIEKGKPKNDGRGENWPDKNILAAIITPNRKESHPVTQPPPFNSGGDGGPAPSTPSTPATPVTTKPTWAS